MGRRGQQQHKKKTKGFIRHEQGVPQLIDYMDDLAEELKDEKAKNLRVRAVSGSDRMLVDSLQLEKAMYVKLWKIQRQRASALAMVVIPLAAAVIWAFSQ